MTYAPTLYWYTWSQPPARPDSYDYTADSEHDFPFGAVVPPPVLARSFMRGHGSAAFPAWCSVLFRRTALELVNGCDDEFEQLYEDANLFLKIYVCFAVVVTTTCVAKYRIHPDSTYAISQRSLLASEYVKLLKWFSRYLKESRVRDASLQRSLKRELWRTTRPELYRWRPRNFLGAVVRRVKRMLR